VPKTKALPDTNEEQPTRVPMPWDDWPEPEIFNTGMHRLNAQLDDDQRVVICRDDELIGRVNERLVKELGWASGFPHNFINKLRPETRVAVINERIQDARDRDVTLISEGQTVTNFVAGWRGILPYRETAEIAMEVLRNQGYTDVAVPEAFRNDGTMTLRLVTQRAEPITPAVGDVLSQGIEILQSYGTGITASLFAQRLACLNGMTATQREFQWRSRGEGGIDNQRVWLRASVTDVLGHYQKLVDNARRMAEVTFSGNPRDVLQEHARAVRMPSRFFEDLVDAFNTEPGNTYWDIANAFTRLATHGNRLNDRNRRRLMLSMGTWGEEFDLVRCRLPRPVAERLGAEILLDEEELDLSLN
jgi:hypothetical protein